MASAGVATSTSPKKPIRAASGKFSTSEAKKRRKAKGIDPGQDARKSTIARAAKYQQIMPGASPELVKKTAEAVTTLVEAPAVLQAFAAKGKNALGQTLMQAQAIGVIHDALPHAAKYLVRLVKGDGDCATAPHSVRRQAAVDLLTLGRIGEGSAAAGKELSEMTADELQSFISTTKQELASRPSKAKEVQGEVVREDEGRVPDNLSGTTGNRFRDIDLT